MPEIIASVGFHGRNLQQDAFTVQNLLNSARAKKALPPIAVDGIVGPETIGAINTFQKTNFGFADGRVDPGGKTINALNALDTADSSGRVRCQAADLGGGGTVQRDTSSLGFVGFRSNVPSTASITSTNAVTPRDEALKQKTECLAWISAAQTALQVVRTLMQTGLTANFDKLKNMIEFQAVNIHFHLDKHPDPLKFLSNLATNYSLINVAISGAEKHFDNDFQSDDFANADPGGFTTRNNTVNPGKMFFCTKYLAMGPLSKVATILHEAGHYIDKNVDHFASAVPFPTGRALTGSNGVVHANNYQNMTPFEAVNNAASYAGFAIHCFKRVDTRPTVTQ